MAVPPLALLPPPPGADLALVFAEGRLERTSVRSMLSADAAFLLLVGLLNAVLAEGRLESMLSKSMSDWPRPPDFFFCGVEVAELCGEVELAFWGVELPDRWGLTELRGVESERLGEVLRGRG